MESRLIELPLLLLLFFAACSFLALGEPSRNDIAECPGTWGDGRCPDSLNSLQLKAAEERRRDIDCFLRECEALSEFPSKSVATAEILWNLKDEYLPGGSPDLGLPSR